MKDILLSYAAYNIWANGKMVEVLKKLPESQLDHETGSSFGSLRKTVYHMWDVESLWYQRLHLAEQTVKPADSFNGSFQDACRLWQEQSLSFLEWVKKATPLKLEHVVAYYDT